MRSAPVAAARGIVMVLLALPGCADKVQMAEVSGNVSVDGAPVKDGQILFVPADGQSPTTGGEIKDGIYSVKVPFGLMKVSLSAPKVVGKKKIYPTPNSPEMPITKEALPARYNEKTELTLDVQKGKNEKDFTLTSK